MNLKAFQEAFLFSINENLIGRNFAVLPLFVVHVYDRDFVGAIKFMADVVNKRGQEFSNAYDVAQ
ncbi:hypothetical protein OI25_355 [Paraburkholderia fungorum]|jgi:hypothetical protein|uniref:Uncharacterized protein n=1 Tax=Paraburkholderia fungorum TaxID=134537 RepID=A0AAP5UX49_9BURK|nr:hypothetical protein [Paraburkholderia fungorum]AJZ60397.1 hypothetical protein OI25_355 [Paraburkholderia fungorum]MBB4519034.1 hypothetical protein [Paraburkholderia fungorum]MBB5546969.1 hypothetical protein [Paraburkholderia fungorum]MBB6206948.1 hypothetical protein [Paraburkholderia fungorum]MDT8839639.1 hypothetical protein [Paraburkholderia fungorum]